MATVSLSGREHKQRDHRTDRDSEDEHERHVRRVRFLCNFTVQFHDTTRASSYVTGTRDKRAGFQLGIRVAQQNRGWLRSGLLKLSRDTGIASWLPVEVFWGAPYGTRTRVFAVKGL